VKNFKLFCIVILLSGCSLPETFRTKNSHLIFKKLKFGVELTCVHSNIVFRDEDTVSCDGDNPKNEKIITYDARQIFNGEKGENFYCRDYNTYLTLRKVSDRKVICSLD
jgi:hypothetical protein